MKGLNLLCASILMLSASTVVAEPAIIITSDSCSMADGNFDFFTTNDVKLVFSNNSNDGNYTLKCSAKRVPNSTGGAVRWDAESLGGVPCTWTVLGISTFDWHETVSKTGNAKLICQFNF